MEIEPHPQATAALDEFKKFSDVLEGALKQKGTGSFTRHGRDRDCRSGHQRGMVVTHLHIEDGLLRLGAETVEERINEALMKAQAEASASNDAMYGATFEALAEIARFDAEDYRANSRPAISERKLAGRLRTRIASCSCSSWGRRDPG